MITQFDQFRLESSLQYIIVDIFTFWTYFYITQALSQGLSKVLIDIFISWEISSKIPVLNSILWKMLNMLCAEYAECWYQHISYVFIEFPNLDVFFLKSILVTRQLHHSLLQPPQDYYTSPFVFKHFFTYIRQRQMLLDQKGWNVTTLTLGRIF